MKGIFSRVLFLSFISLLSSISFSQSAGDLSMLVRGSASFTPTTIAKPSADGLLAYDYSALSPIFVSFGSGFVFDPVARTIDVSATSGPPGANGTDGKSAYEIAVDNGFTGTESAWLLSLAGADGASAYDVAVSNGFPGTESQWLESLVGGTGANGKSAYQVAVDNGFSGTQSQWLASLVGGDGTDGKSAYHLAVDDGFTGTLPQWLESLKGDDGLSAYEIAQSNGFIGTEAEWLESLVGPEGKEGKEGPKGDFADIDVVDGVTRSLNSNFLVSSTRLSQVSYTVKTTVTSTLTGAVTAQAFLEYSFDNATWFTVDTVGQKTTTSLAVSVTFTTEQWGTLSAHIPVNALVRIRTSTTTGGSVDYIGGQEVLF